MGGADIIIYSACNLWCCWYIHM